MFPERVKKKIKEKGFVRYVLQGVRKNFKKGLILRRDSVFKVDAAFNNLEDFLGCLNNKGFVIYGTALGLIREGGIMEHDLDVDVGIRFTDFDYKMLSMLYSKGFKVSRIFGMPGCGWAIHFRRDFVKVDLSFFYEDENCFWNSLWDNKGMNGLSDMIVHSYPKKFFANYAYTDGIRHLSQSYIEYVYGKDWRIPVTPWNWKTDHKCIDKKLKSKLLKKYGG